MLDNSVDLVWAELRRGQDLYILRPRAQPHNRAVANGIEDARINSNACPLAQFDPLAGRCFPEGAFERNRPAEKITHKRRQGFFVNFLRRSHLLEATAIDHRDAIRQRHRLGLIMRHVKERKPELSLQRAKLEAHLLAQLGVEIGERLVEQQ